MKKILFSIIVFLLSLQIVLAQNVPFGNGTTTSPMVVSPNSSFRTCGPITATLSAVNQSLTLNTCPGASNYLVTITTPNGQPAFIGSLTSSDSQTGVGRQFYDTITGSLSVSNITLNGSQNTLEYKLMGGGYGETISVSSYTSGQAYVTIVATYITTMMNISGPVHTTEEEALRSGRAFTVSTGTQSVTTGNALSLMITNPSTSNVRFIIPPMGRVVACNNVSSGALLPSFVSLPNPTTNLPSTSATITRRGGSSGASVGTAVYGNSASVPAISPAPPTLTGNPFFGAFQIAQDRTLEPGNSLLIYIIGVSVPTGLSMSNPSCSIIFSWYEEGIN